MLALGLFVIVVAVRDASGRCVGIRGRRQIVALEGLLHILVLGNRAQQLLVHGLAGVDLLDDVEDAILQMLIEVLRVGEDAGADRALAAGVVGKALRAPCGGRR